MTRTAYLILRLDGSDSPGLRVVEASICSEPGSSLGGDHQKHIKVTLLEAAAPTFEEAVKKLKAELAYRAGIAPLTWGKVATKLVGAGAWR